MARVSGVVAGLVLVASLAGCSGDPKSTDGAGASATPTYDPSAVVKPPKLNPTEDTLVEVLAKMKAIDVGTVESGGDGRGFAYGRIGDINVIVRSYKVDNAAAKGKVIARAEISGVPVRVVKTDSFGIVAAFSCRKVNYEVSVRELDASLSTNKAAVVKYATLFAQKAGC